MLIAPPPPCATLTRPVEVTGGMFTSPTGACDLPVLSPRPPFEGLAGMLISPGCHGARGGMLTCPEFVSSVLEGPSESESYGSLLMRPPARRTRRKRRYVSRAKNKMSSTKMSAIASFGLTITEYRSRLGYPCRAFQCVLVQGTAVRRRDVLELRCGEIPRMKRCCSGGITT